MRAEFWRGLAAWTIGDDANAPAAEQKQTDLLHLVIGPLAAFLGVTMWGLARLAHVETGSDVAAWLAVVAWLSGVASAGAWWLAVRLAQRKDAPGEGAARIHRINDAGLALAGLVLAAPWFWPGPLLAFGAGVAGASLIGRRT